MIQHGVEEGGKVDKARLSDGCCQTEKNTHRCLTHFEQHDPPYARLTVF